MLKFMLTLSALLGALFSAPLFALTNSTPALDADWTPVVQIRTEAPDSSGESIPGYCNATFIAKNIVVTAAHCVKLAYISKDNLINVQVGYYKHITRPDGQVVRVGYVPKSKFDRHVNIELPKSLTDKIASRGEKAQIGPEEDFAILWWNEATPEISDMNFATPVTLAEHTQITKNIKAYPLKVVSINLFSEMSTDTKRMADLNNFKWNNGYVHSKSTSRVEEGDSGAPLFVTINGAKKIFGVVKGKASTVFDNWDVYPAIHSHLCVLNKKMPTDMKIKTCL